MAKRRRKTRKSKSSSKTQLNKDLTKAISAIKRAKTCVKKA